MPPVGGAAIPLGVTELFTSGLSPAPLGPIDSTTVYPSAAVSPAVPTTPSPASPSNVFDSGGTISDSNNPATTVGRGTIGTGFPLSSGLSSVPGFSAVTASAVTSLGGGIPVGASQVADAGLSGLIGVPVPTASPSPCPGPSGIVTGITPALAQQIGIRGLLHERAQVHHLFGHR
jgi:hypothetical protein